ncbi:MAG: hypothetical protein BMS9Abin08_1782 [Gammaproteobacteria bacterium]|nr:MAG: hypothetical protein BMS9Abin08_1782 [Gammaproteobacteria bacterium]
MFLLAWRQLFVDPLRTGLTVLALGAVIAAILVLEGFKQGQYLQMARTVYPARSEERSFINFAGESLPREHSECFGYDLDGAAAGLTGCDVDVA